MPGLVSVIVAKKVACRIGAFHRIWMSNAANSAAWMRAGSSSRRGASSGSSSRRVGSLRAARGLGKPETFGFLV